MQQATFTQLSIDPPITLVLSRGPRVQYTLVVDQSEDRSHRKGKRTLVRLHIQSIPVGPPKIAPQWLLDALNKGEAEGFVDAQGREHFKRPTNA